MAPDPTGSTGEALTARELLDAAKARVAKRLPEVHPVLAPGGPPRAEGHLDALCSALAQVIDGSDPGPLREQLMESTLFGPLMDALGHELMVQADQGCGDGGIAALKAWFSLRPSPGRGRTSDDKVASEDLRTRMKGPDAFELLLEVAHDFRSPLASILFLSEALRDGHSGPVTDLQKSQLGLMYSAAFGLASIASDIMDYAREEKDLIGEQTEPFAVSEVFEKVVRMVRPIVEEKKLDLRLVVPERWQVHGHPHGLSRVLLNLTTNALKFTDAGSVELGARPLPHGRIEYYVQDTGRGMTEEQQQALFRPFRRRAPGPLPGHHFSGSGMGLSIARRLLWAMGSDLALDSSDEHGTRFSFVLRTSGRT